MKLVGAFDQRRLFRTAQAVVQEAENVFCVGRNYREHAAELGNEVPDQPMIFGKSTHTLVPASGQVALPAGRNNIHHELEIVLWIQSPYQPGARLQELVGGVGLGIDLTDRDAQNILKKKGHPWEFAKGFLGSSVVTDLYKVDDWQALLETPFALRLNGRTVQAGQAKDMIFDMQTLVDYIGRHFGLAAGDLIYTGTPEGVILGYPPEQQVWLRPGDEVVATVEGLGSLRTVFA
ncbi:MAG: fumarylacetoacetate hydrolase family protein [Alicyclobacillus sp.]|nr:fumarylacetoacetate hydrolase family protein [Alicyclobacillus sp.]